MRLQLLVLLETNDELNTDGVYFTEVRRRFYQNYSNNYEGEVSIQIIPLHGKQNYNSSKIRKRVRNQIASNKSYGVYTVVILCIDTDTTSKSFKPGSFFHNVMTYCEEHGYELVWYCKNVENVFLNKEARDVNKVAAAKEFARSEKIFDIKEFDLSQKTIQYGCSNILLILDKYLKRNQ